MPNYRFWFNFRVNIILNEKKHKFRMHLKIEPTPSTHPSLPLLSIHLSASLPYTSLSLHPSFTPFPPSTPLPSPPPFPPSPLPFSHLHAWSAIWSLLPDWKVYNDRTFESLAYLGIMGAQLSALWNPWNITAVCYVVGFKESPQLIPHYAERRSSLEQLIKIFPV